MTYFDLINAYLFNYTSSLYRKNQKEQGRTMVEEMNEIRNLYQDNSPIKNVLIECVCQRRGHQYCIPQKAVDEAADALLKGEFNGVNGCAPFVQNNKLFDGFADFEQLYDFVASVISGIAGIGSLTVYDTAKRIGHLFNEPIYPKQYVYLSEGAMDGATVLLGTNILNFREPASLFEPFFGDLPSIFVEDVLCIFKGSFDSLSRVKTTDVVKHGSCIFKCENTEKVI